MSADKGIRAVNKEAYREVASAGQSYGLGVASDLLIGQTKANMGIIRREKSENYSCIYNECFQDDRLSARAKGIFAYLMTLPDDWKIYKSELHKHFREGRDAINTAFSELEERGYVTKTPDRKPDGTMCGWDYTIYESTELLESRNSETPKDGEPVTTKYLSELSTKDTKGGAEDSFQVQSKAEKAKPRKAKENPRRADVVAYAEKWARDHGVSPAPLIKRAEEGWRYYERLDWHDSRGKPIVSWKHKFVAVWFKDEEKNGSDGVSLDLK